MNLLPIIKSLETFLEDRSINFNEECCWSRSFYEALDPMHPNEYDVSSYSRDAALDDMGGAVEAYEMFLYCSGLVLRRMPMFRYLIRFEAYLEDELACERATLTLNYGTIDYETYNTYTHTWIRAHAERGRY